MKVGFEKKQLLIIGGAFAIVVIAILSALLSSSSPEQDHNEVGEITTPGELAPGELESETALSAFGGGEIQNGQKSDPEKDIDRESENTEANTNESVEIGDATTEHEVDAFKDKDNATSVEEQKQEDILADESDPISITDESKPSTDEKDLLRETHLFSDLPDDQQQSLNQILTLLPLASADVQKRVSGALRALASSLEKEANSSEELAQNLPHRKIIDELLERVNSPDELQRIKARIALQELVNKNDVEYLAKRLHKGVNEDEAIVLLEIFGNLRDKRVVKILSFELEHGRPGVKIAAVRALGKIGHDRPIYQLFTILRTDKIDVELRKAAAAALGEIGSPAAIDALGKSAKYIRFDVGLKQSVEWAKAYAQGKIKNELTDSTMPPGRRLRLYHKGTKYILYHPSLRTKAQPKVRLLVCVHDSDLQAESVFTACADRAKKLSYAALVPNFDIIKYPDFGMFNVYGDRADKKLLDIIEHIGPIAQIHTGEFYMVGVGKGGDFVHRFSLAYPSRISGAAFSGENFVEILKPRPFPWGIEPSPLTPELNPDLLQFSRLNLFILPSKIQSKDGSRADQVFYSALSNFSTKQGVTLQAKGFDLGTSRNRMTPKSEIKNTLEALFPVSK